MQAYGNVASDPVRKESKAGSAYFEFRVAEQTRNSTEPPTWYTVRFMSDADPRLKKGDFVRVTGKLKADYYFSRDGKPSGTLLIIAFETSKLVKPSAPVAEPS